MHIVCLDLEGVLVPEVWIAVAEKTGIDALKLTTRDISDYDELMTHRLKVLKQHNISLSAIQGVIATLQPLAGAVDFLHDLRQNYQVIILSDTFYEFAEPLMRQLDWPTLFCHYLEVEDDTIVNYRLRQNNQKQRAIEALHSLNFTTIAAGDSFNDTTMLAAARAGIFFKPSQLVIEQFPQFPVTHNYQQLRSQIDSCSAALA